MRRILAALSLVLVASCGDDPVFFGAFDVTTGADAAGGDAGGSDGGDDDAVTPDVGDDAVTPDVGDDAVTPDVGDDAVTPDVGDDAVTPDGGDGCEGVSTCDTAGIGCDGTELVTCAPDADGCLVAFRTDCTELEFGFCDDSGVVAACAVGDACTSLPDACAVAGRSCDGNELVVCAENTEGCLTERRTVCDATENGFCDAEATPVACGILGDACLELPDACGVPGTSCDGDTLVTCGADAFDCLVESRTDCTSRGGTCVTGATGSSCRVTVDPCEGIEECAEAGASCDADTLVECASDDFGCLVETTTDCSVEERGFCDAAELSCAIAPDPCEGLTLCAAPGRRCVGQALVECAPNPFGCLVETVTACADTGQVCDSAACVDPCSLVTECATDARCAGDVAINCGPDDNGCLVEQSRQTCTGNTECSVSGDTASCVDPCAGIAQCDPDAFPACEGNLAVRCLANADGCFVRSTSNCAAISQVCSEGACEIPCGNGRLDSGETCDDGARRAGDGCSTTCRIEAGYTCTGTPSVCTLLPVTGCGNGVIDADEFEGCDDGNTAAGDGCSPTCAIEVPTNTTTVRTITGALASTDPTFDAPSSGCAVRSSNHYYRAYRIENTTAAAITVNLLAEYDADGYLYIFDEDFDPAIPLDSCLLGDDDFEFNGQPGTRGSLIAGHTIPARTAQSVVVSTFSSGATLNSFTVTMRQPSCGDRLRTLAAETCDDGNRVSGDGCSATCTTELGFDCDDADPTTCVELLCGDGRIDASEGETCDDGDSTSGDGCSSLCTIESGYVCSGAPSFCRRVICGDGIIDSAQGETCDDGAAVSGDGCSSSCRLEPGFFCSTGAPTVCEPDVCGDAFISLSGGERCDDGNATSGDGCSSTCLNEPGYRCEGLPSDCRAAECGDGFVSLGEGCEDGVTSGTLACDACRLVAPDPATFGTVQGSIDTSDALMRPVSSSCGATESTSDYYYDAYWFQNTSASPVEFDVLVASVDEVDVKAVWYRDGFAPASATSSCVQVDEDFGFFGDPAQAELTDLALAPGAFGVLMVSSANARDAFGDYTVTVFSAGCGDGNIDVGAGEACDDGNLILGDGCNTECTVEPDFSCTGEPSNCDGPICGDGFPDGDEACDDDNFNDGDGCSSTCEVEPGFVCTPGFPSVCEPGVCGDGVVSTIGAEECDDGNIDDADGCSSTCTVEEGGFCLDDEPSTCVLPICGDGTLDFDETCEGGAGCTNCALSIPGAGQPPLQLSGTLSYTADPVWDRTNNTCSTTSFNVVYDAFRLTNTSATALTVDVEATWTSDGYLHVYEYPFNAREPVTGCIIGDDDFDGLLGSRIDDVVIEAGQTVVIVASDYSSSSQDDITYTIDVGVGL